MPEKEQLSEVSRVKNHVHGLIQDPIRVHPEQHIGDVLELIEKKRFSFSTFPVVDAVGTLLGLLPGHVVKPRYAHRKVSEALTPRAQVRTISERELGADPIARADRFFTENLGIHKLLVVDDQDRLKGLFTLSDIERITQETGAALKPAGFPIPPALRCGPFHDPPQGRQHRPGPSHRSCGSAHRSWCGLRGRLHGAWAQPRCR
jgi:IMP dehydrogenase